MNTATAMTPPDSPVLRPRSRPQQAPSSSSSSSPLAFCKKLFSKKHLRSVSAPSTPSPSTPQSKSSTRTLSASSSFSSLRQHFHLPRSSSNNSVVVQPIATTAQLPTPPSSPLSADADMTSDSGAEKDGDVLMDSDASGGRQEIRGDSRQAQCLAPAHVSMQHATCAHPQRQQAPLLGGNNINNTTNYNENGSGQLFMKKPTLAPLNFKTRVRGPAPAPTPAQMPAPTPRPAAHNPTTLARRASTGSLRSVSSSSSLASVSSSTSATLRRIGSLSKRKKNQQPAPYPPPQAPQPPKMITMGTMYADRMEAFKRERERQQQLNRQMQMQNRARMVIQQHLLQRQQQQQQQQYMETVEIRQTNVVTVTTTTTTTTATAVQVPAGPAASLIIASGARNSTGSISNISINSSGGSSSRPHTQVFEFDSILEEAEFDDETSHVGDGVDPAAMTTTTTSEESAGTGTGTGRRVDQERENWVKPCLGHGEADAGAAPAAPQVPQVPQVRADQHHHLAMLADLRARPPPPPPPQALIPSTVASDAPLPSNEDDADCDAPREGGLEDAQGHASADEDATTNADEDIRRSMGAAAATFYSPLSMCIMRVSAAADAARDADAYGSKKWLPGPDSGTLLTTICEE